MTFPHVNRRVHLYLGLALLPWFFMYGASSVPFAHNQYFENRDAAQGLPLWTIRASHSVDAPITGDPRPALLRCEPAAPGRHQREQLSPSVRVGAGDVSSIRSDVHAGDVLRRPEGCVEDAGSMDHF